MYYCVYYRKGHVLLGILVEGACIIVYIRGGGVYYWVYMGRGDTFSI